MNPSNCSPLLVQKMFQSLLSSTTSPISPTSSHQKLAAATTSQPLTSPPSKNSIRYIENDQNGRREKYDGHRWRLACTWNTYECTNIAYSNQLCNKHNALRRNKELPKRKRKPLLTHTSLPIMNQYNANDEHDDDNDLEILEEYCKNPTNRCSLSSNIKSETHEFNIFSVENINDGNIFDTIKSEPKMDTVAPEYFYDFLLRHPQVTLHYGNWFLRCKPIPPTTGCLIDTKVWTLSMTVRGAMTSDSMTDECA
ncbi:unnamed protein product [Rotaria sp. Silwood2]|nr:unnamed protein product [Rotaria sp. Silwood2]CAF2505267.1 unnamed protein product [Rotaria sp. Silwood2]CAF2736372.1 unnamed protein product [Rotaria sp. Silwood2]CAF2903748.1 unnamed protein product [Rotaria sp. Silwood2]CAF4028527.1 unnamed protein product [Rotaria sp. Silwood2]